MVEDENFGREIESAFGEGIEILERDELIKSMFEMLPSDLLTGLISDQLGAIEKSLQRFEETLGRLDPVKDAIGIKGIEQVKTILLRQKQLLLDKQKSL